MRGSRILARLIMLVMTLSLSGPVVASDPYPVDYFAFSAVMRDISVSPSGERLMLLANTSKDGKTFLEVYDAANLDDKPFRVTADPMEIRSARWASDDDILINLRQKVSDQIEDFKEGTNAFLEKRSPIFKGK